MRCLRSLPRPERDTVYIRLTGRSEMFVEHRVAGTDPGQERVGFVNVKGRLWLVIDPCGCGAAHCLPTQLYPGIAITGPSLPRRPRAGTPPPAPCAPTTPQPPSPRTSA